jgi:hypothetical protein
MGLLKIKGEGLANNPEMHIDFILSYCYAITKLNSEARVPQGLTGKQAGGIPAQYRLL